MPYDETVEMDIKTLLTLSEYLTGFSKRKKQKIEERRARAKERDHQAHLEARKKVSDDPSAYFVLMMVAGRHETADN